MRMVLSTIAALAMLLATAAGVAAQPAPVGVRAAGMGGAFTAVADDATATYWNPAGLASGAFFGLTLDTNLLDRQSGRFAGFATPPFGISYFRTSSSTDVGANSRNAGGENVFVVHHVGATVVQSIGDRGLAVGATLGVVHGNGSTAFGGDAGIMLSGTLGKVGVTVHNIAAPLLGGVRLAREVRAGASLRVRDDVLAAADVDLTSTATPAGDWRDAAVGVEAHPLAKAWVRGGMHWNTAGSVAAPVASVGGSVSLSGSLRADAQVTVGSSQGNRGWGVGVSFVY